MKATEILEWICRESINGENLNMIEIPDWWELDDEWWNNMFGACPPCPIAAGKYMYYHTSNIGWGQLEDPDATIELPIKNGFDYIHLYKVED